MTTTFTTTYRVSVEQIAAAHRIVDITNHQIFFVVESATSDSEYKVIYNRSLKALQCLPFHGPACKASENGRPCWHKRAAMAAAAEYKAERDAMEEVAMAELQAEIDTESREYTVLVDPTSSSLDGVKFERGCPMR
jgi:hypothetical protein